MSHSHFTKIYAKGKLVGRVEAGIFYKTISGSRHMLRKPPGLAIDLQSLLDAEQAGATRIQFLDRETGIKYSTAISHLKRAGFTFDRGYGVQLGISISSLERPGQPVQLDLFQRAR